MIYCHLGILVAKWSILVVSGKVPDPQLTDQMASRAEEILKSWYLGISLAAELAPAELLSCHFSCLAAIMAAA